MWAAVLLRLPSLSRYRKLDLSCETNGVFLQEGSFAKKRGGSCAKKGSVAKKNNCFFLQSYPLWHPAIALRSPLCFSSTALQKKIGGSSNAPDYYIFRRTGEGRVKRVIAFIDGKSARWRQLRFRNGVEKREAVYPVKQMKCFTGGRQRCKKREGSVAERSRFAKFALLAP